MSGKYKEQELLHFKCASEGITLQQERNLCIPIIITIVQVDDDVIIIPTNQLI